MTDEMAVQVAFSLEVLLEHYGWWLGVAALAASVLIWRVAR